MAEQLAVEVYIKNLRTYGQTQDKLLYLVRIQTRQLSLLVAGPYKIVRSIPRKPAALPDSRQHCQIADRIARWQAAVRQLAALPDSWQYFQIADSTARQLIALPDLECSVKKCCQEPPHTPHEVPDGDHDGWGHLHSTGCLRSPKIYNTWDIKSFFLSRTLPYSQDVIHSIKVPYGDHDNYRKSRYMAGLLGGKQCQDGGS